MIEDPPPLVFAPAAERPPPKLVERFRGVPTSFIVDAMSGTGALDWRIKPLVGRSLVGVALTCDCGPLDNLAFMAALAECRPGDVLVVATGGFVGAAVTGDLLIGVARNRGAAGFVTDGLVRDLDDLETIGLPVYAMGVTPNSPQRRGPGTGPAPGRLRRRCGRLRRRGRWRSRRRCRRSARAYFGDARRISSVSRPPRPRRSACARGIEGTAGRRSRAPTQTRPVSERRRGVGQGWSQHSCRFSYHRFPDIHLLDQKRFGYAWAAGRRSSSATGR